MAFNIKTLQQIQRYLDGEMNASERQTFEQTMAVDEELAQEVVLQRDLEKLLADTPENELRRNLQILSNQVTKPPSSKENWKNFIWLFPLLLVLAIWFFSTSKDKGSAEISTSTTTETLGIPVETTEILLVEDTLNTQNIESKTPKESSPTVTDNPQNKTKKIPQKDTTKQYIYADKTEKPSDNTSIEAPMLMAGPSLINHDFFAPLPFLDSLIAQNSQQEEFQLSILQKLPDTLTLEEISKINPLFTATLSLTQVLNFSTSETGLYLYPNHIFYWKENHPWDFTAAEVEETAENTYKINLMPNLNLEPGLYYYALRSSKTGSLFFIEKLVVLE